MRTLTLRGNFDISDNARSINNQIFSFEGQELTRGWIVKEYYWWPATVRAETGTGDGQFQSSSNLSTDFINAPSFDDISSVEDNRLIAWTSNGYNRRQSAIGDFITRPTGVLDSRALIDPGHIINDALYINAYSTSDSTTSPTRRWNYLVVLEEVKMTPQAAILSLVKGRAQDIDN